jgi:hypothetical protein
VIFHSYVCLPEGNSGDSHRSRPHLSVAGFTLVSPKINFARGNEAITL